MSQTDAMEGSVTAPPSLADRYRTIRAATQSICQPLSPEDCQVQSMPDASPMKWHLAGIRCSRMDSSSRIAW
ncbi:MAG TPA: hypothetical protein VM223_04040 [Planctomycetota bacterium]|nr:hypothetical protein [Planctomycetota bacterium]